MTGYKQIPWTAARNYTKRAVFLKKESTGEMRRVVSIKKRGPNLWVTTADGGAFLIDRGRLFYARTGKREVVDRTA